MYSYDGLRDSLTNLASPAFFYEELRRAASRVERSEGQFSIIRLVLRVATDGKSADTAKTVKPDDFEIIRFADVLIRMCRGEDLCARLGSAEFLVLLFAPESAAESYIHRVAHNWHAPIEDQHRSFEDSPIDLFSSISTSRLGLSPLDLLQNLDNKALVLTV